MNGLVKFLSGVILVSCLSGCFVTTNDMESKVTTNRTVVVDLNAVSKATGQDEIINREMEVVNANLTKQLQEITANLNKQLARHKENFGKSITVEQQQQLQELLIKANQQLQQTQNVATKKSLQHKESLIMAWREKIQPIVREIADAKGANVVIVQSPLVMWFDSAIDITDEVMAELRANPIKKATSDTGSSAGNKTEDGGKKTIVLDASGNVI